MLNARDAQARGATILTRHKVTSAQATDGVWTIEMRDSDGTAVTKTARMVINAAGPWVGDVLHGTLRSNSSDGVRLVRGSHIVTKRLFDHDKCYFFQGTDGRIIFAIPYETDFTLIGTTDADHPDADQKPHCTPEERDYLIHFINQYIEAPITADDVVWTYSGVRPLFDDGASSATAATRDYVLRMDDSLGAPALNVFGGKITTYRCLAESAMEDVGKVFPGLKAPWTAGVALPGGDFPVDGVPVLVDELKRDHPFLDDRWALRLVRAYGTEAKVMLAGAKAAEDLGRHFGANLTEREVRWLMAHEYAHHAEDVVWRRSKLGLRMSAEEIATLETWMTSPEGQALTPAAE